MERFLIRKEKYTKAVLLKVCFLFRILFNYNQHANTFFITDENFIKSHSSRGTLSLVNRGPHSNFSQFMLLFKPIPYFDKKYQVIGKCISGAALLDKMEKVPTTFESPTKKMKVVECGVL